MSSSDRSSATPSPSSASSTSSPDVIDAEPALPPVVPDITRAIPQALRHGTLRGLSAYAASPPAGITPAAQAPATAPVPMSITTLSQADRDTLQASRATLDRILGHLSDQDAVQGIYADLAQDHVALQARAHELEQELDRVYSSSTTFVQSAQEQYSALFRDHQGTRLALADAHNALANRLDNSRALDTARTLLAAERRSHDEDVVFLHDRIGALERQWYVIK
ncbi:hypothetical protein PRNP1_004764 [Phytophthora ramorum]